MGEAAPLCEVVTGVVLLFHLPTSSLILTSGPVVLGGDSPLTVAFVVLATGASGDQSRVAAGLPPVKVAGDVPQSSSYPPARMA